ncbi:sugar ABC transporter, permease protein [Leadbettera azotonutricia ZAS-9]|uniref:sn-glycerol-3-phosphate transport system permease protein UgpE n=2 Tax=Leadbettera azotonutricia TaxID=150829 RepID=F5Y9Z2_LEAAZ|nr:sugar ABC transporter, permease protein [Leadbettera azotonutricia ZAS-9]
MEILSPFAKTVRTILSIILIIYTTLILFVVAMTLLDSFKTKTDLVTNFTGFPKVFSLDSYKAVLFDDDFLSYFRNSLILTLVGTGGCIFLSSLTAYGIARYDFKGKAFLTSYLFLGMMIPVQVSILPVFLILKNLHLLNNLLGLILVYISSISMSCLVFQKFFHTVPRALEESARLDGAGDFKIFFRIVMPVSKPVLLSMALITGVIQWNDFYMPMVLLGSRATKTLTLAIYQYVGQFAKYMSESMAAVVITLIPVIILYFLFSNQMVAGLTSGAIKE